MQKKQKKKTDMDKMDMKHGYFYMVYTLHAFASHLQGNVSILTNTDTNAVWSSNKMHASKKEVH